MARPLRLEYAGAFYHVTSRGDRREDIFFDDDDRIVWLEVLGNVCGRFNWVVPAYCQMTHHYHLRVETVDGNLSRCMRQLNGQYTQRFNRRHKMVGHLFQGRYKAIVVQKETYLLGLSRYVVLNPIRAGMARHGGILGVKSRIVTPTQPLVSRTVLGPVSIDITTSLYDTRVSWIDRIAASTRAGC